MDYIKWIRAKVGHESIILNFSGACVKNHKGQILLQKRDKEKEHWGFPGGAIEIGESVEEALIREIKEETGYEVKNIKFIGIYSKYFSEYPNGDKAQTICFFFSCEIAGGEALIDNSETFDLRFFDVEDLPVLFNQQHRDMLNDYISGNVGLIK